VRSRALKWGIAEFGIGFGGLTGWGVDWRGWGWLGWLEAWQQRQVCMHHCLHELLITAQNPHPRIVPSPPPPTRIATAFVEFSDVASAMLVHQTLQGVVLQTSDRGGIRIQCVGAGVFKRAGWGGVEWGGEGG